MGWPPPTKIKLGLGTFLKRNDPLTNFRNKLNMKNIGTKSVNIMVYLAMFSTTIHKILCFLVLIRWKWVIIFKSLIPSGTWDYFIFPKTPPPPNFELFPTKTWDFFDFLTTPPLFGPFPKVPRFLVWKASLTQSISKNIEFSKERKGKEK